MTVSDKHADKKSSLLPVHEAWLPREHSLYRPRHGRKQAVALVIALLFFATPVLSYTVGARPSEFENRALTPFPSPSQGWSFFSQLSQWATDHLIFREDAVHAADSVSRGVFGEPPPLQHENQQQGPIQSPPTQATPNITYPAVLEGKDGWMYLGEDVASHCSPVKPLATTFAQLRRLRDGVEASGRKFVVVVAPDKATMVPAHLPDAYAGKDCHNAMTTEFWRAVDGENYILDLRGQLNSWGAQLGAPVYGPQDAHWSDEGGVLMARAVAERLRAGISANWKIAPSAPWEVPADLPPLIGRTGDTTGVHYSLEPDGVHDQTHSETSDFTTPLHLDTASGPGTYGLKVGLIGDSFTIRTLPYLAAAFSDMTVLHLSTADQDEGAAIGDLLTPSNVVVLEVAERSLVSGAVSALDSPALDNILKKLAG
jgi:alginate O-acetyltransferase complex protein AlgJ